MANDDVMILSRWWADDDGDGDGVTSQDSAHYDVIPGDTAWVQTL